MNLAEVRRKAFAVPLNEARLPVREVVSATHYVTDLTLGLGEVVFVYLRDA